MSDQKVDLEELKQQTQEAVSKYRETVEKAGAESAEAKQVAEKIEGQMSQFEEKNQELVKDLAEQKKAAEEAKERIETLENSLAHQSSGQSGKAWKNSPEYKALETYLQSGDVADLKALNMGNSTEGGYLVPEEMSNEMLKKITEISQVRSVARTMTVSKINTQVPSRESIPTAAYEGEGEQNTRSQSGYGNETLTCHRLSVSVIYTEDLLMDSAFDLESQINQDVSEAFAKKEGEKFVSGTGFKQPEGFLTNATVVAGAYTATQSSSGALDDADDLIHLTGQLKDGYNPMFAFNRRTLATIRKLKGTDDHYLWQMGLAPDAPATIAGDPYMLFEDMPDIASNALAVVYADFFRGYRIADRTALRVIRDPYSHARTGEVELTFHRWNHGQVVLPEAFQLLKLKA